MSEDVVSLSIPLSLALSLAAAVDCTHVEPLPAKANQPMSKRTETGWILVMSRTTTVCLRL